jgi:hypothetical protein
MIFLETAVGKTMKILCKKNIGTKEYKYIISTR